MSKGEKRGVDEDEDVGAKFVHSLYRSFRCPRRPTLTSLLRVTTTAANEMSVPRSLVASRLFPQGISHPCARVVLQLLSESFLRNFQRGKGGTKRAKGG